MLKRLECHNESLNYNRINILVATISPRETAILANAKLVADIIW